MKVLSERNNDKPASGSHKGVLALLWAERFLLVIITFSTAILCLTPPISRDALIHHLALPKIFLEAGHLFELPCMIYSYYPMNLDVLYGIAMFMGSDIAPKLIHWGFGLLTAFMIYRYIGRRKSQISALAGAILFLSLPVIIRLSTTAYVDLGLVFFSTAALFSTIQWYNSSFQFRYAVMGGIACGLAMGTKYNGLITFVLLFLLMPYLWAQTRRKDLHRLAAAMAVFTLFSALLYSPWAIRNFVWTGNPIYPLYDTIRKTPYEPTCINTVEPDLYPNINLSPFRYRRLIEGEDWLFIALAPIRIFFQGEDNDFRLFDGKMSPLLFILPLIGLMTSIIKKEPIVPENRALLFFSILYILIAFFAYDLRIRYISPAIPPLVVLSIFGAAELVSVPSGHPKEGPMIQSRLRWLVLWGMIVYSIATSFVYIYGQYMKFSPLSFISGQISRKEYIRKFRPETECFDYINSSLPKETKLLFIYMGKRGYYCNRPYVPDRGNNLRLLYVLGLSSHPDHDMVTQRFLEEGITHFMMDNRLALNQMALDLSDREKGEFLAFLSEHAIKLCDVNGFSLYQLHLVP